MTRCSFETRAITLKAIFLELCPFLFLDINYSIVHYSKGFKGVGSKLEILAHHDKVQLQDKGHNSESFSFCPFLFMCINFNIANYSKVLKLSTPNLEYLLIITRSCCKTRAITLKALVLELCPFLFMCVNFNVVLTEKVLKLSISNLKYSSSQGAVLRQGA